MYSNTYPARKSPSRIPVIKPKDNDKNASINKNLKVINRIKEVIAKLEEEFKSESDASISRVSTENLTKKEPKKIRSDNRQSKKKTNVPTEVLYNGKAMARHRLNSPKNKNSSPWSPSSMFESRSDIWNEDLRGDGNYNSVPPTPHNSFVSKDRHHKGGKKSFNVTNFQIIEPPNTSSYHVNSRTRYSRENKAQQQQQQQQQQQEEIACKDEPSYEHKVTPREEQINFESSYAENRNYSVQQTNFQENKMLEGDGQNMRYDCSNYDCDKVDVVYSANLNYNNNNNNNMPACHNETVCYYNYEDTYPQNRYVQENTYNTSCNYQRNMNGDVYYDIPDKETDTFPNFPPGTKLCPACARAISMRRAAMGNSPSRYL